MSFTAELDRAVLSVMLDVRNPFSYLALGPALDLARSLSIEIDWLPLEVPPLRPPSAPASDDDRGTRHRRNRAEALAREIDIYASAQGLVIREPYRDGNPAAAHSGWLWVRHHAPERLPDFLRELFRRYWCVELDPGDIDATAALIDAVAGSGAEFASWAPAQGRNISNVIAQELHDFGLFQVPAYVVENEVFYGRQHLEMIRWIIEGRGGQVPI